VSYPIIGSLVNPDDLSKGVVKDLAESLKSWSFDDIPKAMDEIRSLLETSNTLPLIIYIHCEAGMDRTGEVSGSYYLKYLGWTFQEALWYDNNCIENRDIEFASKNGLQW